MFCNYICTVKEHIPDEKSRSRYGDDSVSNLTKSITHLSLGASDQSSGYGSGGAAEESGSGHLVTVIQRVRMHGGGEVAQKDVKLMQVLEKRPSSKIQG